MSMLAASDSDPAALSRPLHLRAYDRLWDALCGGELSAGEPLKDAMWALRLGVSRCQLRDAFRLLVRDGALDPLSGLRFRVHRFSSQDVGSLYCCRAGLEAVIAEQAARTRCPGLLAQLAANLRAAETALMQDDLEALQCLNSAFHRLLQEGSANTHLRGLLEHTGRLARMARRQVLSYALADAAAGLRSERSAPAARPPPAA